KTRGAKRPRVLATLVSTAVFLPPPGVGTDGAKIARRAPLQQLLRTRRIGIVRRNVAGPARPDRLGDPASARGLERPDHLHHRMATAGAKIEGDRSRHPRDVLESRGVPFGQILHVDVVANA